MEMDFAAKCDILLTFVHEFFFAIKYCNNTFRNKNTGLALIGNIYSENVGFS